MIHYEQDAQIVGGKVYIDEEEISYSDDEDEIYLDDNDKTDTQEKGNEEVTLPCTTRTMANL